MKAISSILLTILIGCVSSPSFGQEYGGQWGAEYRNVAEKTVIDTCILRVVYLFEFATDTVKKSYKYDQQFLDIGHRCTHFYSHYADQIDSLMFRERQRKGSDYGVDLYSWLGRNKQGRYEDIYIDYPQSNSILVITRFFSTDYSYMISRQNYDWQYSYVENTTKLGYTCYKATVRMNGRIWDVWYTTEIGANYGPWKFYGLPGLILSAKDRDGLFRWDAEGIVQPRNTYLYTYKSYRKSVKVKHRDILKLHTKKWKDPVGFCLEHGIHVAIPDESGKNWHTGIAGEYSLPYMPYLELE